MNNKHEHIYDDCIGNPPFAEALKTLRGGDDTEWKLTEEQQRFFDEKKERVLHVYNCGPGKDVDAAECAVDMAKTAKFFINYAENLQKALNRVKAQRTAAMERTKHRTDFSKAWGALVACYQAINRNFGDKIREHIEKNNRTQKEGQMRALMEQMQRLTK
jgi:hypothetical protein